MNHHSPEHWFDQYLKAPHSEADRTHLHQNREDHLAAGHYSGLPSFGTGGMRQVVAHGSNRLNEMNIARLNLALADFLQKKKPGALVLIGFDSRLSSPRFSRLSYHLLKSRGFRVKVFRRPTPTPLLSFAVRHLHASMGIVLTASHNPSPYNGYKVYGEDGGQIVSPVDKEIENNFRNAAYEHLPAEIMHFAQEAIPEADLMEEEIAAAFLEKLGAEAFTSSEKKKLSVLYSPLHGAGGWLFEKTFRHFQFENFSLLPEQAHADGNFPNAPVLNPEEEAAFALLIAQGKRDRTDLLLATDPDADRVGAAVRLDDNSYRLLTGNEIGSLLLYHLANQKAKKLKSPYICKTIVTTELQTHIAAHFGVKTVETLTGFKFIAEQIQKNPESYLFGGEESYGYLAVPWIRDKDSVSSAIALAELAAEKPLLPLLDEIHCRFGLYHETLVNLNLEKYPAGFMEELLGRFSDPRDVLDFGARLGVREVIDILDLSAGGASPRTDGVKHLKENLPVATVIQYYFSPEGRLTIRPSGTEPKIKIYVSLRHATLPEAETLAEDRKALKAETDALVREFLKLLKL